MFSPRRIDLFPSASTIGKLNTVIIRDLDTITRMDESNGSLGEVSAFSILHDT